MWKKLGFFTVMASLGIILLILVKKNIGDIRYAVLPAINITQGKKTLTFNLPSDFKIEVYASNILDARDIAFSPGNEMLVSQPSLGKVLMIKDKNGDGTAKTKKDILSGLQNPHGLAFYKNYLFVAEETKVTRYIWDDTKMAAKKDKEIVQLPKGGRHVTRSILIDKNGQLYISIGSTCDVCYEKDQRNGTVMITDVNGNKPRIFAKGLRNAVFLALNPNTQQVWATEMGRDFLGDITPPDEIDILSENKNYGWPLCYGDKVHDTQFDKNQYIQDPCNNTESPIYPIPAHSAPLGLTFIKSPQFASEWQGDLLVAYHGSWNKSVPEGYKVVHLKVDGDKIISEQDFITGFIQGGQAIGRPVDVAFDNYGSLYISDDKAGTIYRVLKR
jgi:glucose/arabinose dehydrogenase